MPHSLKLIFVFLYFIQYKTTFLSTGLTKSSFGFFHKPYRKTRTNLLANAISSINPFFFGFIFSFPKHNVHLCSYFITISRSMIDVLTNHRLLCVQKPFKDRLHGCVCARVFSR